MAAEWFLRGYRVDKGALLRLVGSKNTALRRSILAAAKKDGLHRDHRLPVALDQLVDEVLNGTLDRTHATAYRILLGAVADATQKRLTFSLPGAKGYTQLTTYALRERVPRALTSLGMTGFARGWKKADCPWPRLSHNPRVKWPMAMLWCSAEVTFNLGEAATVASFDLAGDEQGELADVARVLIAYAKGARGKSLLVFVDGEQ